MTTPAARRGRLRLHRGQSAAPGRAYRHRGGARRRSRAVRSSRSRPVRTLASLGLAQASCAAAARLRHAAPRQHGGDGRGSGGPSRPAARSAMFDLPSGPGVRVDTFGYSGYRTSAAFDSLLAKVIVHSPSREMDRRACTRRRAPCANSASAASPPTSRSSAAILAHQSFARNKISTGFIDSPCRGAGRRGEGDCRAADRGPARPPTTQRLSSHRSSAPEGSVAGAGAAAGHDRRDRGRGGRPGPPRPADRGARIDEDGASGRTRRMAAG